MLFGILVLIVGYASGTPLLVIVGIALILISVGAMLMGRGGSVSPIDAFRNFD